MEGIRIRLEESRQTSHSPVGKFDKNHFGSASQQVFVLKPGAEIEAWVGLELELEELAFGNLRVLLSFMVTFAIIIIMCRVQWQQHFLACLAGSSGNWGLASLLWPHLTVTVVLHSLPFSLLPPSCSYLSQPTQVIMQIQKFGAKREKFHEFSICQLPTANWPRECDTRLPWILFNCDFNLPCPHTLPLLCLSLSLSHSFWQRQCDNDVWQKGEWVKSFCQLKYEYLIGLLMQTLTHTHTPEQWQDTQRTNKETG